MSVRCRYRRPGKDLPIPCVAGRGRVRSGPREHPVWPFRRCCAAQSGCPVDRSRAGGRTWSPPRRPPATRGTAAGERRGARVRECAEETRLTVTAERVIGQPPLVARERRESAQDPPAHVQGQDEPVRRFRWLPIALNGHVIGSPAVGGDAGRGTGGGAGRVAEAGSHNHGRCCSTDPPLRRGPWRERRPDRRRMDRSLGNRVLTTVHVDGRCELPGPIVGVVVLLHLNGVADGCGRAFDREVDTVVPPRTPRVNRVFES
jgi:hypothetical protein